MNEQTLEMQIHAKAQEVLQSLNKLTVQLTGVEKKIDNVSGTLKKVSANKATSEMNNLNNSIEKASKSMSRFKNLFTFAGVKRLTQTALSWINEAVDQTEQLNLFNVVFNNVEKNGKKVFSNLGKEATQFQYKLNEAFGTNKTQSLYTQAIYQSMGENQGISDYYASIMSETMTKFTYDLASLYNKSEKTTAEALRAGVYSGQTKPVRNYGLDITQTSMQPILNDLGIDKQVKELSQAEKMILRYIAVLRQGQVAMGDFANTIESPSNQMKIFRQQLVEAKVAISSLFIGTFAKILPYANAFLMVIKEVSKAIASFFGIELQDYNTSIATPDIEDYSSGISDIGDSANKASKAVKELKRQTLGFDEIHNIDENKDNGTSGGTGGVSAVGGIDQRLLDAIKGYDNGMDKVRMKALDIRDSIMEWLGFHKEIDPLTGKLIWKYDGIKATLSNMWKSFRGLSTEGKVLVGLGLVIGATKLWNAGKKLVSVFGNSGLGKVIKSLYKPTTSLFSDMLIGLKSSHSSLKIGIKSWREQMGIIDSTTGKVDGLKGAWNGAKIAVKGLITGAVGLYTVHQSMKSIGEEGANLVNVFGALGGSLGTIASGVQIGAIFGGWGPIIGGAAGAVVSLISALHGFSSAESEVTKQTKEINSTLNEYENTMDSLEETRKQMLSSGMAELNHYDNLYRELKLITDENGNIQKGYEARADYIVNTLNDALGTEISIVDGQVQKYGELESAIYDSIEAKKAQLLLEAHQEEYLEALKQKTKLEKEYERAVQNSEEAQKKLNEAIQNEENPIKIAKLKGELDKANETVNKAGRELANNQEIIKDYDDAMMLLAEHNYDAVNKVYNDTITFNEKTVSANNEMYEEKMRSADAYIQYLEENKDKYDEDFINSEKERCNREKEQWAIEFEEKKRELENQNKVRNQKTLEGINEQLKIFKDKNIEFKDAGNGLVQMYVNGVASGEPTLLAIANNLTNGAINKIKSKKASAKEAGEHLIDGVNQGVRNSNKQNNVYSAVNNFGSMILKTFRKVLDEHSPSRATNKYGQYLIEGFNIGIDQQKIKALQNIKDFSKQVLKEMNFDSGNMPTNFIYDINKAINFSEIQGKINTNSEINIGENLVNSLSEKIVNGINTRPIQVDVNSKIEKGTIVEVAVAGINQETTQTGVCPINIPTY